MDPLYARTTTTVSCTLPECPTHPKPSLEERVAKLEKAQMIWRVPPDLLRQLRAIVNHIETRPATGYSAVTLHTDEDGARALLAILEGRE